MVITKEFRSLEQALADLIAKHERTPDPRRARTIELIQAEIQHRELVQASPPGAWWKIAPTEPGLEV
jgi:hypothetical protein